jgi:hypothetical protein
MSSTDQQISHTPGPWLLYRDNRRERYDIGVKGQFALRLVAEVQFGFSEPAEREQHANARLIAAAPDLLEALKRLAHAYVSTMESGRDRIVALGGDCDPVDVMERGDPYLRIAKEAIAKAEGRS